MQSLSERIADEVLVMDAQHGRRAAFDLLVSRWQKRLWRHALNLTGRTDAAWDITQEAWLDIVKGLRRLNDSARFGAWAYRIVSHKAYDWRNRHRREQSSEPETEDARAAADEQGNFDMATDVYNILPLLSRRAQVVLNLYYLEGFGLAEIAGIVGMPEGTVKSRLHAARLEFRKRWESLGNRSPARTPASRKE